MLRSHGTVFLEECPLIRRADLQHDILSQKCKYSGHSWILKITSFNKEKSELLSESLDSLEKVP